jgi:hypothetical protein
MPELENIQPYLEAIADSKAKALLQHFSALLDSYSQRITDLETANADLISRVSVLEAGEINETSGPM